MTPIGEPDEGLEWLALLEELDLPLDTVGRRVRFWQEPPGALAVEVAAVQGARVAVTRRFAVPLERVDAELGAYRVAIYLVPAEALDGPLAPPLWALTAADQPLPARWVRETVRAGESPVALEARWRAIGEERVRILGLSETVPKREIDRAWAAFPLLREYQGIGQAEEAFRQRVRDTLAELGKKPSNFAHGLSITRLAKLSGFSRPHFSTRLTTYGIDPQALRSWRPGQPMPL